MAYGDMGMSKYIIQYGSKLSEFVNLNYNIRHKLLGRFDHNQILVRSY